MKFNFTVNHSTKTMNVELIKLGQCLVKTSEGYELREAARGHPPGKLIRLYKVRQFGINYANNVVNKLYKENGWCNA